MSLILEALKKAERQHRLGEVPGLGTTQHADLHDRSKLFGILLVGGVAIGMLTLGLYLGEEEPAQRESRMQESAIELPPPVAMRPIIQLDPPVMPDNDRDTDRRKAETADERKAVVKQRPIATSNPIPQAEKPPVDRQSRNESRGKPRDAKLLSELPAGFIDNLPVMNIDIHSFDERPGHSYVLINMEKYHEGDYLAEGPLLSEILEDGVVLEHLGERFILPIGNY